jgi:hypothetical protein
MSIKRKKQSLSEELNRFKDIVSYQKSLDLTETNYRFYRDEDNPMVEAPEDEIDPEAENQTDMQDETGEEEGIEDFNIDNSESVEQTVEVDVTDLIKTNKSINDNLKNVDNSLRVIKDLFNKVSSIEDNLNSKMTGILDQIKDLTKQVELVRPPTEEERRKKLAKGSYPFSVTMDDYKSGEYTENQTDLENISMDSIISNYNEFDVRKSFSVPKKNIFDNL